MPFEDELRNQLNDQVPAMPLQGAGADAAIARSRQRERRRRTGVAIVAVAVIGLGTIGIVRVRSGSDDLPVASQPTAPAENLGPLNLSWQTTPGGVGFQTATTLSSTGVVYALSTAPGAKYSDYPNGDAPQALYRLGDDGTWQPISVGAGNAPRMVDLGASGGLLYSLSTSPSAASAGYDAVLSSSGDDGASWSPTTTLPIATPNDVIDWEAYTSLQIQTSGDEGVALLASTFSIPPDAIEAALAAQGVDTSALVGDNSGTGTRYTAEGVQVTVFDSESVSSPTTVPAEGADPVASRDDAKGQVQAETVIGTVPWSALGLTGRDDLRGPSQLLVRQGDVWTPVDIATSGLDGFQVASLDTLGSGFVAEAYSIDTDLSSTVVMVSDDGLSWRPATLPGGQYRLLGVGSAWLAASYQPDLPMLISTDQGAHWTELDLESIDPRLADMSVWLSDTGPLGLAAVVGGQGEDLGGQDGVRYLVTTRDLVNWTVTPIDELIDRGDRSVTVTSLIVGTDRVVLVGTFDAAEAGMADELADAVTLVGTPTRD